MRTRWILAAAFAAGALALTVWTPLAQAQGVDPSALRKKNKKVTVEDMVKRANEEVDAMWKRAELSPTRKADDYEWCRRAYLDLIGRIPTVKEVTAFAASKSANKRAELIDTLLASDECAEHFAIYFGNLIVGRVGGQDAAEIGVDKRAFEKWAKASWSNNKPWDQWVMELITAKGTGSNSGPANFHLRVKGDSIEVASRASQLFLGIQIQCAQCHNHPFDEWKQADFWGMVGFFVRTRVADGARRPGRLYTEKEVVDVKDSREEATYYIKNDPRLPRQTQLPKFLKDDAEVIKAHEFNNQGLDRRYEFARWVTDPETVGGTLFAKAAANRMWYYFLGRGIINPVDDMGSSKRPVSVKLLNELAEDFKNSGYDLKRLVRVIMLAEPYQLSSVLPKPMVTELIKAKNPANAKKSGGGDDLEESKLELYRSRFTHFYTKTMTPEQMFYSIVTATGGEGAKGGRNSDTYIDEQQELLGQFVTLIDNDENREVTRFEGSIPLALRLLNGDIINKRVKTDAPGLQYFRKAGGNEGDLITRLYLATLSRPPSPREMEVISKRVGSRKGDTRYEDVFWALLNTSEFMFVH